MNNIQISVSSHNDRGCFGNIGISFLNSFKRLAGAIDINIIIKGDETIAVIDDKAGKARRNKSDAIDDRIGIVIATMRALRFKKEEVEGVIDVLFDDLPKTKELKDYSSKELMRELNKRLYC